METRTGTLLSVVALALAWAFIWAMPGGVIEAIDNVAPAARSFTRRIDMWPQTLGLPGLLAGVLFSVLIQITDARRRLADLPLLRSGIWGAASGLVAASLVVWGLDAGLSNPWQLAVSLVAVGTLLGAVAGAGSPLLFRFAAQRRFSATS